MKSFRQFLDEGVHDPGIFKAIFLAGGPGSGKTFIATRTLPNAAFGLKILNSDQALEFLLKKSGLSTDMLTMTPQELEKFVEKRAQAKKLIAARQRGFLAGRLGLILDGTGRDFERIKRERQELVEIGYDTFMVFVNTSLEVALERNRKRSRRVDEKVVRQAWSEVQTNIGKFQGLFGSSNFLVVDNSKANEDVLQATFKAAKKFITKPPRSLLAKKWIASELGQLGKK